MIVQMQYQPNTRTANIVNTADGTILLRNVPLREVKPVLDALRYELAQAARQAKVVAK